jgi:hypothetical protein
MRAKPRSSARHNAAKSAFLSLPLFCAALAGVVVSSSTESQGTHGAAKQRCDAAIAFVGTRKACPIAEIRFRVSVPKCEHSAGTYEYSYLLVNEVRKEAVSRSGQWKDGATAWEQVDKVPLACDDEIDDVADAHVTACSCAGSD